jgi:bifunctional non-homologous end joining protein LigD
LRLQKSGSGRKSCAHSDLCLHHFGISRKAGNAGNHEIKHIARKKAQRVRLYSRAGNDLTHRFPLIVETLARLCARSCIIDWEAVACDDNGVASFNLVRYLHHDESIFLYAFDLIEFNGDHLRRDPLAGRRLTLEKMLGNRPRFFRIT